MRPSVTVHTDMGLRCTIPTSTAHMEAGIPTPCGIMDVPTGLGFFLAPPIRHGMDLASPGGAGINRGVIGDGIRLMAGGGLPAPAGDLHTRGGVPLLDSMTLGDGMRRMAGAVHLAGAIPMDGMATPAILLDTMDSAVAWPEMDPTGVETPVAEIPVAGLAMVGVPPWNRNDCRLVWCSVEKFPCELL